MKRLRRWHALPLAAILGLTLSGCGETATEEGAGGDEGFEFGASQDEINEIISDLEPVTLTYQPSASSPDAVLAETALAFQEAVEERSNGQITLEMVWGQAVAGYSDLTDALADGRLDLATHLAVYEPDEFPTFDALSTSLSGVPTSPVVGEAVQVAVAAELGEQSESLREEFEAQGISAITPIRPSGVYYALCGSEDTSASDWSGNTTRVGSTAHHDIVEHIGATPVSIEWVEAFEALERGTIDCSVAQLGNSADGGIPEVASHIMYTSDENALPARTVNADLAGPSVEALPMAYQQIIYDSMWVDGVAGSLHSIIDGNQNAVEQAHNAQGSVVPFDDDVEEMISEANSELLSSARETGLLSDELLDSIPDLSDKWEERVQELGYEDQGTIEDLDEWWEPGSVDFTELTEDIYVEVGMDNRPG